MIFQDYYYAYCTQKSSGLAHFSSVRFLPPTLKSPIKPELPIRKINFLKTHAIAQHYSLTAFTVLSAFSAFPFLIFAVDFPAADNPVGILAADSLAAAAADSLVGTPAANNSAVLPAVGNPVADILADSPADNLAAHKAHHNHQFQQMRNPQRPTAA